MPKFLPDLRGRVAWVILGCLVCQMGLGYGYTFGPLAPDIIAEFGWTRTMYSAARAPQLFVIALASPLIGFLTIRFGARRVLCVATLILSVAFGLLAGLQSLWQLYVLVALQGLAVAGLGDIAVGQAVSQWVRRGRGLALGIVYTGSNLGGALLTRATAEIAVEESWRIAFLAMGIGALVVILPFALFAVREPEQREQGVSEPSPDDGELESDQDLDLRAALHTRSFWILGVSLFTFFFYFLGMLEHLVLFLTDHGMPLEDAAGHFSNAILLGMASKVLFGFIADRLPKRTALLLDYGLLATSSVILLWLPDPAFMWAFVLSYGFSTAARDVIYPLIISHCFGLRYMAQIYGALMLALLPGGVLGPIFAAATHDALGSYQIAFTTFAGLNLLVIVALWLVRDERKYAASVVG